MNYTIPFYKKYTNSSNKDIICYYMSSGGNFAVNQLYFMSGAFTYNGTAWNANTVLKAGTGSVILIFTPRDIGRNKSIYIASLQIYSSSITIEIFLNPTALNYGELNSITGGEINCDVYPLR